MEKLEYLKKWNRIIRKLWKNVEKNKIKLKINQFNINTINYIITIMNEADFIQEIMKQANLSEDQGGMVNEIFQNNFIGGEKTKTW